MQNEGSFQICAYYCTDPEIRSRLVMLYSFPEELRYYLRDTNSLTADHMQHFTGFRIEPWEEFRQQTGSLRLVQYKTGWDWSDRALAADGAVTEAVGEAVGGDSTAEHFSQQPTTAAAR